MWMLLLGNQEIRYQLKEETIKRIERRKENKSPFFTTNKENTFINERKC